MHAQILLNQVDFADLAVLDLSKAGTEEGRKELSQQLVQAMRDKGFFYVVNHGYTQAQVSPCAKLILFRENVYL